MANELGELLKSNNISPESLFADKITGYGAFLYPHPITVYETNPELAPVVARRQREIVLDHDLPNGQKVIVTDDGFFGVFMKKPDALRVVNTIFATGLTWSLGSEVIREDDLCGFYAEFEKGIIVIHTRNLMSPRNVFSLQRDGEGKCFEEWEKIPRKRVKAELRKF